MGMNEAAQGYTVGSRVRVTKMLSHGESLSPFVIEGEMKFSQQISNSTTADV